MADSSEGSSSNSSLYINEKIELAKSIAQRGMDNTSILQCLEEKVAQLLKSKEEAIDLQAKYNILQESTKLLEAEFTFQKSESEKEINQLKQTEKELRDTISKLETEKVDLNNQYNIKVDLANDDSTFQSKYQKWKEKAHNLSYQLKNSQFKSGPKENILDQDSDSDIENLREELKETKSKNKELSEKLEALTNQLDQNNNQSLDEEMHQTQTLQKLELEKLQKSRDVLSSELDKAKQLIEQQKSEIESFRESDEVNSLAKEDNQKLKNHIKLLKDKIKQYQGIEAKLQKANNKIEEIDLEKENISEILGFDNDVEWHEITSKIQDLMNQVKQVQDLSKQNEKLKKRLSIALEDSNAVKISNVSIAESDDQYVQNLRNNLKESRKQNEIQTAMITQLQYKNSFALPIEKVNKSMMNEINDIYSAIIQERSSMRPLLLAIVFTQRFFKLGQCDGSNISTLLAFGGRTSYSPEFMIAKIREKFGTLTQDLIITKQNYIEISQKYQLLSNQHEDTCLEIRSRSDEVKVIRKKYHLLKHRMIELQNELSQLVSPEIYDQLCERIKDMEKIQKELNKRIREQEEEIEKRTKTAHDATEEMEKITLKLNEKDDEVNARIQEYEEKEREVETLKSIIREKTKEILALERIVHRHKEKESTTAVAFSCLASENKQQDIELEPKISTAPLTQNVNISTGINPAFLGQ